METTIKITTKEEIFKEHEISLPHFTKTKFNTYFKILGVEKWDVIKVCPMPDFLEVSKTLSSIALQDTEPCTELEFNQAFEMAIEQLKNIHK